MKNILKSTFAALTLTLALGVSTMHADGTAVPATYPLKTCPVSGDTLGGHGKAVKVTAPDGTDVYLCCKQCVADFNKDPAKYAKMVKDAAPAKK
jgi:YHS domain-containing protein